MSTAMPVSIEDTQNIRLVLEQYRQAEQPSLTLMLDENLARAAQLEVISPGPNDVTDSGTVVEVSAEAVAQFLEGYVDRYADVYQATRRSAEAARRTEGAQLGDEEWFEIWSDKLAEWVDPASSLHLWEAEDTLASFLGGAVTRASNASRLARSFADKAKDPQYREPLAQSIWPRIPQPKHVRLVLEHTVRTASVDAGVPLETIANGHLYGTGQMEVLVGPNLPTLVAVTQRLGDAFHPSETDPMARVICQLDGLPVSFRILNADQEPPSWRDPIPLTFVGESWGDPGDDQYPVQSALGPGNVQYPDLYRAPRSTDRLTPAKRARCLLHCTAQILRAAGWFQRAELGQRVFEQERFGATTSMVLHALPVLSDEQLEFLELAGASPQEHPPPKCHAPPLYGGDNSNDDFPVPRLVSTPTAEGTPLIRFRGWVDASKLKAAGLEDVWSHEDDASSYHVELAMDRNWQVALRIHPSTPKR